MAEISEAKRAANRENARRSTGPRTVEGKEKARLNALKHGLTAGTVVNEELKELVEKRVARWKVTMRPQDDAEAWLVERAAMDSVRVDAASRCERARTEARLAQGRAVLPGRGPAGRPRRGTRRRAHAGAALRLPEAAAEAPRHPGRLRVDAQAMGRPAAQAGGAGVLGVARVLRGASASAA